MKRLLLASLLILILPVAGDVMGLTDYRDWTSNDGKKLNAKLIKIGPNSYSLKSKRDGRTYDIPIEKISSGDLEMVKTANKLLDDIAKKAVTPSGEFGTLGDCSEKFWRLVVALGRVPQFAQIVCGECRTSSGAFSLMAKDFRRESNKSFLIEGDGVMARIQTTAESDNIIEMGEKLQVTRKVRSRSTDYSYYGWHYDTKLDVLRQVLATRGTVFQPAVGSQAPFKLLGCRKETIGVGEYLVFTLHTQFSTRR